MRSLVSTDEGDLEVVAKRIDGRWLVTATCAGWRASAIGEKLSVTVDAALGPYAGGVRLPGDQDV